MPPVCTDPTETRRDAMKLAAKGSGNRRLTRIIAQADQLIADVEAFVERHTPACRCALCSWLRDPLMGDEHARLTRDLSGMAELLRIMLAGIESRRPLG